MKIKTALGLSGALALTGALAWAPPAPAATTITTTFQVTVTVVTGCAIQGATDLDFGSYLEGSPSNLDGTSTITVLCSTGTPYVIALSAGSAGTVTQRALTIPGHGDLLYNLYTSTAFDTAHIWHDTTDANCVNPAGTSTNCVYGTGTGSNQVITVNGRIPSGQNPGGTGTGTSTITVTVTF